ncbi:DUF924 family protein [Roseobacter sp. HKCCA0434]|uniref:DUF924 family protein n=1 Tax=Roseobacter sp. HKCCA0434 TaxID=3079297 RepID=UPI002905D08C|nr:DUF924 family protein [Roseobacter sp. HKCCA0434]
MQDADVTRILDFWIEEVGPEGWYKQDDALDAKIRHKFEGLWSQARRGEKCNWMLHPRSALALLILTDQFPRNMFRGRGRAFSTDRMACAVALRTVNLGYDCRIEGPQRQFFYLPMMHAENISWQEKCVRQFLLKMPQAEENLLHARAHREVIRRFGRFPHRNEDLGRQTTEAERNFMADGGYGGVVRELQAA